MKARSALVTNKQDTSPFQRLTINFLPNTCRLETLENRQHTVIPMVILVEGVHAGSDGPLYYPAEELSKTPAVWNHKPIVVYHPEMNGQGISACDPVVINNRKIGVMMNTQWDPKLKRLTSEAWIEQDRANAVDERIMSAVTKNEMMELSTGVFVDVDNSPGEWAPTANSHKKEAYNGVARNYRPDHLALLPDKTGACSISDGAGFLRNEARKNGAGPNFIKAAFESLMERWGLSAPTQNEMSFSNIRESLSTVLRKRFNVSQDKPPYLWVEDVYSNFVIYEFDGKLFRLGYSASDTGVTLSEEQPTPVQRVTEYRTVEGAKFVGNQDQPAENHQQREQHDMEKAKIIAAILAANCGWTDQKALEALTDNQLQTLHKAISTPQPSAAPAQNQQTAPAPQAPPAVPAPVANTTPVPRTVDEYIAAAPGPFQEVLRNAQESLNAEKAQLIGTITKNGQDVSIYSVEELQNQPIGNLRKLARLAQANQPASTTAPRAQFYGGQAPLPTDNNAKVEALPLPTMNFEKAKA